MKKADVIIGEVYIVKVSGKIAEVEILAESPYGGYVGRNLKTKREIRVKTAARLRYRVKNTGIAPKRSEESRERFDTEVRFNWGYHDGASDHENGRRPMINSVVFEGTLEEWAARRGGGAYIEGYLAGHKASTEGVYNRDSKSAFAESGLSS